MGLFSFFFHFRDLKEQSPDLTAELEWDPFVDSPMKLIKRNMIWSYKDKSLD